MVHPAPEHEVSLRQADDGKWLSRERACDVVRCIQWDETRPDRRFLLGIENQLHPHVLMPWRVMEMQNMFCARQLRALHRESHGGGKGTVDRVDRVDRADRADRAEFLSKVPRTFRFRRMVTVVIHWGTDDWDTPRQFADLLEESAFPELLPFEPRMLCPMLIPTEISPEILDGMEKFLKLALQYVCASRDRGRMERLLKEHPEYQALPRDFAQGLLEVVGSRYQVDSTKETVNMCKAIEDMMNESKAVGMEEGMKEGGREMARGLVRFMREKDLPEDMLREFLARQNFSPEQIADLCAAH